uniref:3'(2'),5'-bisphosphate nucleotidase n=1 Tax=Medicago truncatula TaxID=3880 RepID=B7FK43_MEDTR|nr:unknown [Medicago truncatula]
MMHSHSPTLFNHNHLYEVLVPSHSQRPATLVLFQNSTKPVLLLHLSWRMRIRKSLVFSPNQKKKMMKNIPRNWMFAVRAVQMACSLCLRVQESLISKTNHQVQSKDDNSPVTVADWSVQAVVSWILSECLGSENISIVAEEDVQTLSKSNASELLDSVVKTENDCLAEAPRFGVQKPKSPLGNSEVLDIISRCNSTGGPSGRFWVLDPVDGTLGFVRGDQYAVALALVEDGEVVLGVLGCPNYPMRKEWLSYQHRYHRIVSKLTPPTSESWNKGCVLYAKKGTGKAWMQPLLHVNKMFCVAKPCNTNFCL